PKQDHNFLWSSGTAAGFTRWANGQPNSGYDFGSMSNNGYWYANLNSTSYYGVIEFDSTAINPDGLPKGIDPFPGDPLHGFDLRASDGTVYQLASTGVSGTSGSFLVTNGPLQPGNYTFTVTTSVADGAGNHLAQNDVTTFSVGNLATNNPSIAYVLKTP